MDGCISLFYISFHTIYINFIYRLLSENLLVCGCELTRGLSDLRGRNVFILGTCKFSTEGLKDKPLSSFIE